MLNRVTLALSLALLAFAASTGAAQAARGPDAEEVIVITSLVSVALMLVLLIAWLIKRAVGLDKLPPPEPDSGHNEHH
jgi:hypothetical protein